MAQLRREVTFKSGAVGATDNRRFQPGRRKAPVDPRPAPKSSVVVAEDIPSAERAPSVEMAWLIRASSRMDEEQMEVQAFLAQAGLQRFAPLLLEAPGAPGTSMEALQAMTEERLRDAGLPSLPRYMLLCALEAELQKSSAPSFDAPQERRPSQTAAEQPQWATLGRAPPGWRLTTPGGVGSEVAPLRTSFVGRRAMVDAACGGDDEEEPEAEVWRASDEAEGLLEQAEEKEKEEEEEEAADVEEQDAIKSLRHRTPSVSSSAALSLAISRPVSSKLSRPGTSSASAGKVCCYECFRQVYEEHAVALQDEVSNQDDARTQADGVPQAQRLFCSEACAERCRQALGARQNRERELGELRSAVLAQRAAEGASEQGALA